MNNINMNVNRSNINTNINANIFIPSIDQQKCSPSFSKPARRARQVRRVIHCPGHSPRGMGGSPTGV